MTEFKTDVKNTYIDIWDAPMEWAGGEDCELCWSDAEVDWIAEFETRAWGIKGMVIYIRKVSITIGDTDMTFEDNEDGWEVTAEHDYANGLPSRPEEIEIDYKNKKVEVIYG